MSKATWLGKGLGLVTSITTAVVERMKVDGNEAAVYQIPADVVDKLSASLAASLSEAAGFYEVLRGQKLLRVTYGQRTPQFVFQCVSPEMRNGLRIDDLIMPEKFFIKEQSFSLVPGRERTWQKLVDDITPSLRLSDPWELVCFAYGIQPYVGYLDDARSSIIAASIAQDPPYYLIYIRQHDVRLIRLDHFPKVGHMDVNVLCTSVA